MTDRVRDMRPVTAARAPRSDHASAEVSKAVRRVCRRSATHPSGVEPVARAAHGDEVLRLLRVRLEPLSELTHEVVYGAYRADRLPPHLVEQLVSREHLAR